MGEGLKSGRVKLRKNKLRTKIRMRSKIKTKTNRRFKRKKRREVKLGGQVLEEEKGEG